MQANEYQKKIKDFAIYPEADTGSNLELYYLSLGLAGEVGEICNKVNKLYRNKTYHPKKLTKKAGDSLWLLVMFINALRYNVEDIMGYNYAKLKDRQERGVIGGNGDNR